MPYRLQVKTPEGWRMVRPAGGIAPCGPYAFPSHDAARRMAGMCYPLEHSHACRVVYEIEARDAGKPLDGLGYVLTRDIGKLAVARAWGLEIENDAQRDARYTVGPRCPWPAVMGDDGPIVDL